MTRLVTVLRPFVAGAETLERGAVVDASGWKWTEKLIRSRYVREYNLEPPKPKKEASHAK